MPERNTDNNHDWPYRTVYPGMDLEVNPSAVDPRKLVKAQGIDGRFLGSLRPFPGFADSTVHGIPSPGYDQIDLQSGTQWTLSGSGTGEYYLEASGGGDPGVVEKTYLQWQAFMGVKEATLGSLTAVGSWGFGDNDSLGFNTYYLKAASNPTGFATVLARSTQAAPIVSLQYAKYVSIRKGTSGETYSGIAYIARSIGGTGVAHGLYFAYRDSSDGSTDVVQLEDFDQWQDWNVASIQDFDITAQGRYIYLSLIAVMQDDTPGFVGVPAVTQQDLVGQVPYNKAYYWDFKINSWDIDGQATYSTSNLTFMNRIMGSLSLRSTTTAWNDPGDAFSGGSRNASTAAFQATLNGSATSPIGSGGVTYGVSLVSRKHNLRSPLRVCNTYLGSGDYAEYIVESLWPTARYDNWQLASDSVGNKFSTANAWGIGHADGLKVYRSTNDSSYPNQNAIGNRYAFLNPIHVLDPYLEPWTTEDGVSRTGDVARFNHDNTQTSPVSGAVFMKDAALVQQEQYDPYLDEWGSAPRFKRLISHDGMLVGITQQGEPSTPDRYWDLPEQQVQQIAWSSTIAYEPENFPAGNRYQPDDAAEDFLALEPAGDHLFAISNQGIYRLSRAGSQLSINRLQFRLGGVGRYSQTGVGNSLFIVTEAGVKQVDGNTGSITSLPALDRKIIHDAEWAQSLNDVQVEYDAALGALLFLNTTKQELVILWESTGAVTSVVDCPWSFITSGPKTSTVGSRRVYFVTPSGGLHIIDGSRQMGKRTMCGTAAGETVNGTTTAASTTVLTDTTATFPSNCIGFKVYMLSGTTKGESSVVTASTSTTLTVSPAFSDAAGAGARYSLAPVVSEIVLPQLSGETGPDLFATKITSGAMVALSNLGGEATPAGLMELGVQSGSGVTLASGELTPSIIPDRTAVVVNFRGTQLYPFFKTKFSNQDWELQALLVSGVLSKSKQASAQVS